ncbi:multidrug DMT transporter permease [Intrasporangium oryzae NRRL B-24470]|uniref:Multidrug DMT transporter permease n=1 Tax=Intrasporangium oryzae NRRL B-24470 TaxID=1386089 RepID=W9G2M8_9MICO|nr:MFS transporter [Intrasporangium oryzae]EWT00255.1 multidrug DMT transporter permease [Intrasporangium oryzae NRRL B-24470]
MTRSRVFPVAVFVLTFGLLLSDYMSRQVLSAVFPFLKVEWVLTDTQLGSLTSIVALTVGLLAVPLSLLGDRWGRSKAIILMGALWSLATLGCAIAANYEQMMLARFFIGLGEAAYGSVGLAVVLMVFSPRSRASLTGAFMAGGSFGSVLGVFLGGILAVQLGWRWSFGVMAVLGIVFVLLYAIMVNDGRLAGHQHPGNRGPEAADGTVDSTAERAKLRALVSTPSVISAYVGSGLQLFMAGALFAWLPSYLNRAYHLRPDKAGIAAAGFILLMGVGMIVCGVVTDRLTKHVAIRKWTAAIVFTAISFVALTVGFTQESGGLQLVLIAVGAFFTGGTTGPAGAMVANLTPASIRATAFGTLTLANNLLGLAAGPLVVGAIADRVGLVDAMKVAPLVSVIAIIALLIGRRAYPSSLGRVARVDTVENDTLENDTVAAVGSD